MADLFDEIPDADAEIKIEASKPFEKPKATIDGKVVYGQKPYGALCDKKRCCICNNECWICNCHRTGIFVFTYQAICSVGCLGVFSDRWKDQYRRELEKSVHPEWTNQQIAIVRKEVSDKLDEKWRLAALASKDAQLDSKEDDKLLPKAEETKLVATDIDTDETEEDDWEDEECEDCGESEDDCICLIDDEEDDPEDDEEEVPKDEVDEIPEA